MAAPPSSPTAALIEVRGLAVAPAGQVILQGLDFDVHPGEVLAVAGGSGCGKSTLLRHLVGLQHPVAGQVRLDGADLHAAPPARQAQLRRRFGVMFQAGALWSSMSVGENLMLPLEMFTPLSAAQRAERAREVLAQVGLDGVFDQDPGALSGGMRKRAAIARALVLRPELLFLDEPSAGLDPPTAARLDRLIMALRDTEGTAVVLVTHELQSIFKVADRLLFLDAGQQTMTAIGPPQQLLRSGPAPVRDFLRAQGPC